MISLCLARVIQIGWRFHKPTCLPFTEWKLFYTKLLVNSHIPVIRYLPFKALRLFHVPFIHLAVCLTTGPKHLPKRALHIVRSRAFSCTCEYPLLSLRSSSSFLLLLPRLPVTSIPHFIFPSITCCRRQFLHKMWPIQLAFRLHISCRIFLCSLTLSNTSSFLTWSVQLTYFTYHQF
jgi:hypothetical protein